MAQAAIELIGINKSFGAVRANRDINLEIARGTIHGIVGENGAGKSTLMSILYGFYQADSGEIRVDGKPASIKTPNDAIALGIGMVHQHFMLVDNFTVLENIILGAESDALLKRSIAKARSELEAPRARIRARGRSRRDHRGTAGRPAAARRNPQGALSRRRDPDPRRADRRADAGRGRPSVPHPQAVEGAGQDRRADHPQAARDHGHHRQRLGHAPGHDGGDARDQEDHRRGTGRADGRAPRAAAGRKGRGGSRRRQARGQEPDGQGFARRHHGRRHLLRHPRRRDRRHRRCRRQRPVRTARGDFRHQARRFRLGHARRQADRPDRGRRSRRVARPRARPCAGGPPACRAGAGLRGEREFDPRLSRRPPLSEGSVPQHRRHPRRCQGQDREIRHPPGQSAG